MEEQIILDQTKNETRKIVCNRCDNRTNHIVCGSVKVDWGDEDVQGTDIYEIVRCSGCDSISFRVASTCSEDFEYEEGEGVSYPVTEKIYPSRLMGRTALKELYLLPDKVRSIYRETHAALCTKLKILAGVGIRALIESVCSEKNSKAVTLEKKIDDLVVKEVLTKGNAAVLHKTRLLGNKAVHEITPLTDDELDVAFDIVENLLETVYIIPKKAERLK
jgi:hypothetical protein